MQSPSILKEQKRKTAPLGRFFGGLPPLFFAVVVVDGPATYMEVGGSSFVEVPFFVSAS
jgi:hypothetical protein